MRTSNFAEGRGVAGFFRLCLGIVVILTLAMGGMALNTQPVQAHTVNLPVIPPILLECVPFTIAFSHTAADCPPVPPSIFFWWLDVAAPAWVTIDPNTGVLTGCPPLGTAGTSFTFQVECTEMACCPYCPAHDQGQFITLNIGPHPPATALTIVPTFYPVAWEDMPFSMPLSATGCSGNYTWSTAGLPLGLDVTDPVNGIISGTPAPGTCGFYPVTATVTDIGTCCCPPISAPFTLIVDCFANYDPGSFGISGTYTASADYDFTVEIGPGLAAGQTNVVIDGTQEVTLGGSQTETFTTQQGESHSVTVDQTIAGPDPKTRYAVKGSNEIMVSETNTSAYFDYAQQVLIDTGSDPGGISQPGGTGWYAIGDYFNTTTASPVNPGNQPGTKYIFRSWSLPDGSTDPNRDLAFTVNRAGVATALYDTYYLLQVKSDYPAVDESSYELEGSTASYNLALQATPMLGFWGALGGVLRPINSSGSHIMDGPYIQKINWSEDWFWPVFWIVVTLLAIAAVVFFVLRRKRGGADGTVGRTSTPTQPPADAAVTTVKALPDDAAGKSLPQASAVEPVKVTPALSAKPAAKKALPEAEAKAEQKDKPNFCPKCGSPVDEGAGFCKKCGNKLG